MTAARNLSSLSEFHPPNTVSAASAVPPGDASGSPVLAESWSNFAVSLVLVSVRLNSTVDVISKVLVPLQECRRPSSMNE